MDDCWLLVDGENVGQIDLASIPQNVRVTTFFGAAQKTVPIDHLPDVSRMGERFEPPVRIGGQGKNALDFHIAYYLERFDYLQCLT